MGRDTDRHVKKLLHTSLLCKCQEVAGETQSRLTRKDDQNRRVTNADATVFLIYTNCRCKNRDITWTRNRGRNGGRNQLRNDRECRLLPESSNLYHREYFYTTRRSAAPPVGCADQLEPYRWPYTESFCFRCSSSPRRGIHRITPRPIIEPRPGENHLFHASPAKTNQWEHLRLRPLAK